MALARLPSHVLARMVWVPISMLMLACQADNRAKPGRPKRAATETSNRGIAGADLGPATRRQPLAASPETQREIARIRDVSWNLFPQAMPPIRLAFFANNLGFFDQDALAVVPVAAPLVANPCRSNRLAVSGPRELATLADQRLLVVGATSTFVLDSNCHTKQILPKLSYLPGYHLWPDPRWPSAFSVIDPASGRFFRFRWSTEQLPSTHFLMPTTTLEDPKLKGGPCGLMRDGALACVHGRELVAGWPGHRSQSLGFVAEGPTSVRVLAGDRVDHVRLIRGESLLEEYWLVKGAPLVQHYPLPSIPFDMVAGPSYIALIQIVPATEGREAEEHLLVLESDGTLRWSLPRGPIPRGLSEREWVHQYFECRGLATHPTRHWLAVSDCAHVDVFDARTAELIQRIPRAAP